MTDEAFMELQEREKALWAKERAINEAHEKATDEWLIVHRQVEHERCKRAMLAELKAEGRLPEVAGQGVGS